MTGLVEKFASFTHGLSYDDIPVEIVEEAKRFILDTIGVMIAGSRDPIRGPLFDYLDRIGGKADATIVGSGRKASVCGAAFANGVLGHVDDYDDTNHVYFSHQSIAILPAILALAESQRRSGADVITAYVAGTEVQWRLGDAMVAGGDHYRKGWHATGTIGTFGAAASAARILGLDRARTACAIGLAASEAAGIQAQFGTQAKPFQAGRANESGVRAALFAQSGFTSSPDALDGKVGYIGLVTDECDREAVESAAGSPALGRTRCGQGQAIKAYPICGAGNGLVGSVLELRDQHRIDFRKVAKLVCRVRPASLNYLNNHVPESGLEAKFSIGYWIAAPLVFGRFGMQETSDTAVRNPDVRELMAKIAVVPDENVYPYVNAVEIYLEGQLQPITANCDGGKGSKEKPLTLAELHAKFIDCAKWGGISTSRAAELADEILALDRAADVSGLMKKLVVDPSA